jgi:hypothetical protein
MVSPWWVGLSITAGDQDESGREGDRGVDAEDAGADPGSQGAGVVVGGEDLAAGFERDVGVDRVLPRVGQEPGEDRWDEEHAEERRDGAGAGSNGRSEAETESVKTSILAVSMTRRWGTALKLARIMPLLYSLVIVSTPSWPTLAEQQRANQRSGQDVSRSCDPDTTGAARPAPRCRGSAFGRPSRIRAITVVPGVCVIVGWCMLGAMNRRWT